MLEALLVQRQQWWGQWPRGFLHSPTFLHSMSSCHVIVQDWSMVSIHCSGMHFQMTLTPRCTALSTVTWSESSWLRLGFILSWLDRNDICESIYEFFHYRWLTRITDVTTNWIFTVGLILTIKMYQWTNKIYFIAANLLSISCLWDAPNDPMRTVCMTFLGLISHEVSIPNSVKSASSAVTLWVDLIRSSHLIGENL